MKILLSIIVIFVSVNSYAQSISKVEEIKINNQVKVIKSYVEPWNTTGIRLVQMDSTKSVKRHSCGTTIKNGEEPLLIVDGIIKDFSCLKEIKPNDIQSVEVLKDKAATDKYGAKAKHGAIIITMKCKEQNIPIL